MNFSKCLFLEQIGADFNLQTTDYQGWGRDKEEDDEQWWRRCLARSAAMMRPGGKKRQRGR